MKKVCLFNSALRGPFHGYELDSLDPAPYFAGKRGRVRDLVDGGLDRFQAHRALTTAAAVDEMYRDRDPAYMRYVDDFVERFADFDIVVLSTYCCIHPEVLHRRMPKPTKVLGFIDDPYSTYIRGIPYLWAFDGAFYISPSYLDDYFDRALERWGCRNHVWWPLCPPGLAVPEAVDEEFFVQRERAMVYVGRAYNQKLSRLAALRARFGDDFAIYGAWKMKGLGGVLHGLAGNPTIWRRVREISFDERRDIYLRTKIGFNMHLSEKPTETGNMRMYEVPAHGMMLLCDKAALDAHERIFEPDREAVFYDSTEDAIDKAAYYLAHDGERVEIAWNGFRRARRDYDFDRRLLQFLDWASALRC